VLANHVYGVYESICVVEMALCLPVRSGAEETRRMSKRPRYWASRGIVLSRFQAFEEKSKNRQSLVLGIDRRT
jgi:hypothetical protein